MNICATSFRLFAAVTFCIFVATPSFCDSNSSLSNTPVQRLNDGIAIAVASNPPLLIELHVATPHAFRLHLSAAPDKALTQSVFLSGALIAGTKYEVVDTGTVTGIKTSFGELLVDRNNLTWSLLDETGTALTTWAPLNLSSLQVGASPAKSGALYYGSGSSPNIGSITQDNSPSKPGNGTTSLPQYWSNAGYGLLMVTESDNHPGSWQATSTGAVNLDIHGTSADVYLAPALDLYSWLRDQAELTGFAPVPPLWTFGYMQSRWGWESKQYIDDTVAHFQQDNLPLDAIILDFEWYTATPDYNYGPAGDPGFVDYGYNSNLLPDPTNQFGALLKQGIHVVGIRKPRLSNSVNVAMAKAKGWILPLNPDDPNGGDIRSRNIDYSNPGVQAYWQQNNRKYLDAGLSAFWNDEGETTFSQYSYWNLTEVALFNMVNPQTRFWSLNRSFAPGLQRFGAAVWTGDISSTWDSFAETPGRLLSYSLSGMPYSTCDIGGFYGATPPELLARWMEAGVFFPDCRSHSSINDVPHFPWLYGQDAENAIRKALDLRYQLIPYYYSLAFENNSNAAPLMRPLVMEFPDDVQVQTMTDEWLMGRSLLAAPLLTAGGTRSVYLPNDTWFDFGTNQVEQGPETIQVTAKLDQIPIYVRAGTILPLGPVVQNTSQVPGQPLEVQVYPGHDGSFTLVQDDGATRQYRKGIVRTVSFTWTDSSKTLQWKTDGKYRGANLFHLMKIEMYGPQGEVTQTASPDKSGSVQFN